VAAAPPECGSEQSRAAAGMSEWAGACTPRLALRTRFSSPLQESMHTHARECCLHLTVRTDSKARTEQERTREFESMCTFVQMRVNSHFGPRARLATPRTAAHRRAPPRTAAHRRASGRNQLRDHYAGDGWLRPTAAQLCCQWRFFALIRSLAAANSAVRSGSDATVGWWCGLVTEVVVMVVVVVH